MNSLSWVDGTAQKFNGANVVKVKVTLADNTEVEGGQDVDVQLRLQNASNSADATNEEFNQTVTVTVPEDEKEAVAIFTVAQAGKYKAYDVTETTSSKDTRTSIDIQADASYDDLWLEGVVETNGSDHADVDGTFWYEYDGSAIDLKVTKLTGYDYAGIDSSNYKTVWYKMSGNAAFDITAAEKLATAPTEKGTYYLTVWPAGDLDKGFFAPVSQPIVKKVVIEDKAAAKTFSLYQKKANAYDTSDTTFTYGIDFSALDSADDNIVKNLGLLVDGKIQPIYVVTNGKADNSANAGNGLVEDCYYLDEATYTTTSGLAGLNAAGEHTLEIKQYADKTYAANDSRNQTVAYVKLNVAPFDLSKAVVTFEDVKTGNDGNAVSSKATLSYDGVDLKAEFDADGQLFKSNEGSNYTDSRLDVLDLTSGLSVKNLTISVDSFTAAAEVNAPSGYDKLFGYKGTYSVEMGLAGLYTNGKGDIYSDQTLNTAIANFAFSGDPVKATVRAAADIATDFVYDPATQDGTGSGTNGATNVDLDGNASIVTVDLTKGQSFDAKKIHFKKAAAEPYNGSNATVKIYKDGKEVSDASAPGTYKVVVSVTPDREYKYAGTCSFTLQVNGKSVTSAEVLATVEGKIVTANSTTPVDYDGNAIDWSVVVRDTESQKVLTEGSDYKVAVNNAETGEAVDSIVDPGTYTITVTSGDYTVNNGTPMVYTVKVNASVFDGFEIVEQTFGYDASEYDVKGSAIAQDKGIAYTGSAVVPAVKAYVLNAKGDKVYTELDPSVYELSFTDSKGNKVLASELIKVGEYTAAISLTKAAADANIKSVPGTDTFEIVDTIAGGFSDVKASEWYADEATKAKQLGYMTGLSGTSMLLPNSDITRADVAIVLFRMAGGKDDAPGSTATYPTKFADVAEDAYYAKAVDWAYKAGIITGYDGSSNFGPNDLVTREQLATMIARFAEKVQGEDVSAGEIDGYVDADSVQGYAKPGMAYCVEAGIFGVNTDTLDPQGNASRAQVAAISVRVAPAQEL